MVGCFFGISSSLSLSQLLACLLLACCVAEIFLKYFSKFFVTAYSFMIDHHSFFVVFAAGKKKKQEPRDDALGVLISLLTLLRKKNQSCFVHWQHGYVESGTKSLVWSFSSFAAAAAFCVPFWFFWEKAQNKNKIFFLLQKLGREKSRGKIFFPLLNLGRKKSWRKIDLLSITNLGSKKKLRKGRLYFYCETWEEKTMRISIAFGLQMWLDVDHHGS